MLRYLPHTVKQNKKIYRILIYYNKIHYNEVGKCTSNCITRHTK